jgi:hypothetical protein
MSADQEREQALTEYKQKVATAVMSVSATTF